MLTLESQASKNTGWENWQRERLVREMNDGRRTVPLLKQNPDHHDRWEPYDDTMRELSRLVDISFTTTAHCDASTCTEMENSLHFSHLDQPVRRFFAVHLPPSANDPKLQDVFGENPSPQRRLTCQNAA